MCSAVLVGEPYDIQRLMPYTNVVLLILPDKYFGLFLVFKINEMFFMKFVDKTVT